MMKILITDDDDNMRNEVSNFLTQHYECDTMTSGDNAVEHLKSNANYDLFINDLEMPGINGLDLAREIRKLEGHSETPIVIFTISASDEFLAEIKTINNLWWIVKPLKEDHFLKSLQLIFKKVGKV